MNEKVLLLLFLLSGCNTNTTVSGKYAFYESYDRVGRSFEHVVACAPMDNTKPFCSDVVAYKVDETSIQLALQIADKDPVFVLFHPNENGFDCIDDTKSKALTYTAYKKQCKVFGYPILLTGYGH